MAVAEKEVHREIVVQERIARLETHVQHIRKDVGRVEGKVDALDRKVDEKTDRLDRKIGKLDEKGEGLGKALAAFQLEVMSKFAEMTKGRMADRIWMLLIGAALLGVMARGFKWI